VQRPVGGRHLGTGVQLDQHPGSAVPQQPHGPRHYPPRRSLESRFTELYGRFIGGLLNAGKPLILRTADAGEIYLLINRKEFMETTDDRRWEKLIKTRPADEH
jgi:hypothetical protein